MTETTQSASEDAAKESLQRVAEVLERILAEYHAYYDRRVGRANAYTASMIDRFARVEKELITELKVEPAEEVRKRFV